VLVSKVREESLVAPPLTMLALSDDALLQRRCSELNLKRTLADMLGSIEQKKSVLYFSGGMTRSGTDNQVELRATTSSAVRANMSIYPVDTRGLQAIVPGGDASRPSARGVSAFSGRGVNQQFDRLFASQETLQTLASDTGGRAFTDTNDFGEAFTQVQRDTSLYYLLGYNSTNASKDGRFRRITVRVKNPGLRVEHRAGYYAERDFAHTNRQDRERQLQEQLAAPVSATDLPVMMSAGWFRLAVDRYYVPLSVAVPGGALRESPQRDTLDVLGIVRDEQGRPVGRLRETLDIAPDASGLASRQLLYQAGLTLPPGRFVVKVVVRENATGLMGTFEAAIRASASELRRPSGVGSAPAAMGFITVTRRPAWTSDRTRAVATTVLPTSVSVPVTNRPRAGGFATVIVPVPRDAESR